MARETIDFRAYLERNYPKMSDRLPDAFVEGMGGVWKGWMRLGYFRYLVAAGVLATIPLLMDAGIVPYLTGSYGKGVLVQTGLWTLLALGLGVVVGLAGLLDLGYVAFYMLGAYMTALMTASGAEDQFHFVEWPAVASIPFALAVAMLAGVLLGIPTLRLRGDYLAIVTLGFHEIVRQSANNLEITNASRGIPGIPRPSIFGFEFGVFNQEYYWWFLLIPAIILAVIMIRHMESSRVGRYWTAIREDEVAAGAMGVPVVKMKVLAFAIGASTSGVAGWIYATWITFISPNNFPLLQSILVLCAVVIGGLGSVAGAALGAVIVIALPEVVRSAAGGDTILGFDPETGRIAIFGFLLIVVMIFRPGGLLAARRRRTELTEAGPADEVVTEDEARMTAAEEDLHGAGGAERYREEKT